MGAVKVAVLRHHLRLKPQAEFQPHGVELVAQLLKAAAHLLLVDEPVAQTAVVIVPLAEPAVVQHQHFDAQIGGLPGNLQNLFLVEIEISSFPVVDEHRTGGMLVVTPADVLPDDVVVLAGQGAEAGLRVAQHDLRGVKSLAGLEGEPEPIGMDAQLYPGLALLVPLDSCGEVAAVHQAEAVALACGLGGVGMGQQDGGIVVVAGGTPGAAHRKLGKAHRCPLDLPLHGVTAGKVNQVKIPEEKVQGAGQGLFQHQCFLRAVFNPGTAGDDVSRFPDTVNQGHPGAGHGFPHVENQSLSGFVGGVVKGRHTGNRCGSCLYLIAVKAEIGCGAAVGMGQPDHVAAVISHAAGGKLLGQAVQGIGAVGTGFGGVTGKSGITFEDQLLHIVGVDLCAIIGVEQDAAAVYRHLVAAVPGFQGKSRT